MVINIEYNWVRSQEECGGKLEKKINAHASMQIVVHINLQTYLFVYNLKNPT